MIFIIELINGKLAQQIKQFSAILTIFSIAIKILFLRTNDKKYSIKMNKEDVYLCIIGSDYIKYNT